MEAKFVTICHIPRTHRVCVYKGISALEFQKLISAVFKTGNRKIVGLRTTTSPIEVVPLGTISFDPSVLSNEKRYVIVFGSGKIEKHLMPYDFHAVIHHIASFVESLRERNVLNKREAETMRGLIECADRAVLLAFTFFRIDRNVNMFAHTLVRLAKISDQERKRTLARILALNECMKRFGYSSNHAHILQRAVLAGDSRMDQVFLEYESTGGDFEALRNSLWMIVNHNKEEEEENDEEREDSFLELLDAMVESGSLDVNDAAWMRGRRVAGDSELCEIASEVRRSGLDRGDISNAVDRIVSLTVEYEKIRSSQRQNLAQLIDDIPQDQISSKSREELKLLAIEGNDLVISAYEVFAVDLDKAELFETLLMILSNEEEEEEEEEFVCGVNTKDIDPEFVRIIRDVVHQQKTVSIQVGETVLRLMQAGDEFIVAAFEVYKQQSKKTEENRLAEFLDTVGRVVQRRIGEAQSAKRRIQERDEILETLVSTCGDENKDFALFFMKNLNTGPALDGVRIVLETYAKDGDKENLFESLDNIAEMIISSESEIKKRHTMKKNKIELKALITSMLVERVASLEEATALRRLVDSDDVHVMSAHDAYIETGNKLDLYDTLMRIARRVVQNLTPFEEKKEITFHDEVLSIVSSLDGLSSESREVLVRCIKNHDPTVSSAIELYAETRDLDEFKEMLRVIAENTQDDDQEDDDEDEDRTAMLSPDASMISSNNTTTFLSPALSALSSTPSSSHHSNSNLNRKVESDRVFSTALRVLTSGADPIAPTEVALLQNMYNENDMIMTVALDFYKSNNDMDELLDTFRTAVRAAQSV